MGAVVSDTPVLKRGAACREPELPVPPAAAWEFVGLGLFLHATARLQERTLCRRRDGKHDVPCLTCCMPSRLPRPGPAAAWCTLSNLNLNARPSCTPTGRPWRRHAGSPGWREQRLPPAGAPLAAPAPCRPFLFEFSHCHPGRVMRQGGRGAPLGCPLQLMASRSFLCSCPIVLHCVSGCEAPTSRLARCRTSKHRFSWFSLRPPPPHPYPPHHTPAEVPGLAVVRTEPRPRGRAPAARVQLQAPH